MRWCTPYPGRSNPACCDWRKRPCLQRQWPDRWNILLPRRQSNRVWPDEKWGSSRVRSGWAGKKLYESMQGRLARFFDRLEANPAATLAFVMNYRGCLTIYIGTRLPWLGRLSRLLCSQDTRREMD